MALCSASGCENKSVARGLCSLHYQRAKRGAPFDAPRKAPPGSHIAYLESLIGHDGDACVTWPFRATREGYGAIRFRGKNTGAHRVMCELAHGQPPEGTEACHSCGNGRNGCVNPNHLRWDTAAGNKADMAKHGTRLRGTKCASTVLSEQDVFAICDLVDAGRTKAEVARKFGIHDTRVHRIASGEQWGWLTGRSRLPSSGNSECHASSH